MKLFDKQSLKKQRSEPHKIIEIARQIENSGDSKVKRLVPKQGDGKSQASLCVSTQFDWFTGYQHETAWDKYEDYQNLIDTGIKHGPMPYFICGWAKALGIKNRSNGELMDKEKVPDRFTDKWNTLGIEELRQATIEKGGKYARKQFSDHTFVQFWNNQFSPDKLEHKVIFSTVDMAVANSWMFEEMDVERVFVDEGVAGRTSGQEIGDVKQMFDKLVLERKNGNSNHFIARDTDSELIENLQKTVNIACKIQEDIEQGRNCNEKTVESFGSEYKVGIHQPDIPDLPRIGGEALHEELLDNEEEREELIQYQELLNWLHKCRTEGLCYVKQSGNVSNMVSSKHQLDRLRELPANLYLLRAAWSPAWDDAMNLDPEFIGEDMDLRETDMTEYQSKFIQVVADGKEAMTRDKSITDKAKYLWKLADSDKDMVKIGPDRLRSNFSDHFYHYEQVQGKNLGRYDRQISIGLPRLKPHIIFYEAVKEFKTLPDNPNDEDTRKLFNGSLEGYKCELLQAIWETRIEAKVVDSWFRTMRNTADEKFVYHIGLITNNMRDEWFGNLDIYQTTSLQELQDSIIHRNRMWNEAIELSKELSVNLRDREWTQGQQNKRGMRVNLSWAAEHFAWMQDLDAEKLAEMTGRNIKSCYRHL